MKLNKSMAQTEKFVTVGTATEYKLAASFNRAALLHSQIKAIVNRGAIRLGVHGEEARLIEAVLDERAKTRRSKGEDGKGMEMEKILPRPNVQLLIVDDHCVGHVLDKLLVGSKKSYIERLHEPSGAGRNDGSVTSHTSGTGIIEWFRVFVDSP